MKTDTLKKIIFFIDGIRIGIKIGDITKEKVDAIVNPANTKLQMGGGVSLNIRKKGGFEIEKEAMKKGPIKKGEAIFTNGWKLPSKYVIHTATMEMNFKSDYKTIEKCMENTLNLSEKMKIKSVSFPALGCGTGKLKLENVSKIMIEKVMGFLSKKMFLEEINFILYKKNDFEKFLSVAEKYLIDITKKTYKNPIPTVDIIIEYGQGIILIERKNYPYGWALPGGFVNYGESLENTAEREAKEETGLELENLKQFYTYSQPGRDPRYHTISTVFTAKGKGKLKSGDDAKKAKIFKRENFPEKIAFDHKTIISDYFKLRSL